MLGIGPGKKTGVQQDAKDQKLQEPLGAMGNADIAQVGSDKVVATKTIDEASQFAEQNRSPSSIPARSLDMSQANIFTAAATGDLRAMIAFTDADGWEPDAVAANGWTALHCAANAGEAPAGALLVEYGASRNAVDDCGDTPLHLAARHNRRLVASMLLWSGAEVQRKNRLGNTALHEAVLEESNDVAWLIAENGGEMIVLDKNSAGLTPLAIAKLGQNQELIDRLDTCVADLQATAKKAALTFSF